MLIEFFHYENIIVIKYCSSIYSLLCSFVSNRNQYDWLNSCQKVLKWSTLHFSFKIMIISYEIILIKSSSDICFYVGETIKGCYPILIFPILLNLHNNTILVFVSSTLETLFPWNSSFIISLFMWWVLDEVWHHLHINKKFLIISTDYARPCFDFICMSLIN